MAMARRYTKYDPLARPPLLSLMWPSSFGKTLCQRQYPLLSFISFGRVPLPSARHLLIAKTLWRWNLALSMSFHSLRLWWIDKTLCRYYLMLARHLSFAETLWWMPNPSVSSFSYWGDIPFFGKTSCRSQTFLARSFVVGETLAEGKTHIEAPFFLWRDHPLLLRLLHLSARLPSVSERSCRGRFALVRAHFSRHDFSLSPRHLSELNLLCQEPLESGRPFDFGETLQWSSPTLLMPPPFGETSRSHRDSIPKEKILHRYA